MMCLLRTLLIVNLIVLMVRTATAAECTIEVSGSNGVQHLQVAVPLPADGNLSRSWSLVEKDQPDSRIPAQLIYGIAADGSVDRSSCLLLATIPPQQEPKQLRTFVLDASDAISSGTCFTFVDTELSRSLTETGSGSQQTQPVWQYNYRPIVLTSLPEDDPRRSRSCYVHPVWGMDGEVLTDDFPVDHYHHHGIFWTWPYVQIGDQTYDSWLGGRLEQRFIQWLSADAGAAAGVLGVENGWFVEEKQVAVERVWLRSFRSQKDCRVMDLALVITALAEPIALQGREEKSYGGFTVRYHVSPRTDATVRAAQQTLGFGGDNPATGPDLVNTRLPWADLSSQFPGATCRSGAAVFIHPRHPDYPPTWLTRTYGALCVGWPGIERHTIAAGESIRLDYRVWVHRGEPTSDQLDAQYRTYCQTLEARCH